MELHAIYGCFYECFRHEDCTKVAKFQQKQLCMDIAREMLTTFNGGPNLFKKVTTGDELQVYGYVIETKAQSSQCKRPEESRPKIARQVRSNVKVLLTVFFDCNGVMNFCKVIRSTTWKFCADCAKQFVKNSQNQIQNFALYNSPAHTSMLAREFLAKIKTVIIPPLPYSPDMARAVFFLFAKLKTPMKGKCFATIEEIKEKSKQKLLAIIKSAFQKCLEDWKKRWNKCLSLRYNALNARFGIANSSCFDLLC